jgi:hypothetical protein
MLTGDHRSGIGVCNAVFSRVVCKKSSAFEPKSVEGIPGGPRASAESTRPATAAATRAAHSQSPLLSAPLEASPEVARCILSSVLSSSGVASARSPGWPPCLPQTHGGVPASQACDLACPRHAWGHGRGTGGVSRTGILTGHERRACCALAVELKDGKSTEAIHHRFGLHARTTSSHGGEARQARFWGVKGQDGSSTCPGRPSPHSHLRRNGGEGGQNRGGLAGWRRASTRAG